LSRVEVDTPDNEKQFGTFLKIESVPAGLVYQVVTLYHDKQTVQHEYMLEPRENVRPEQGKDTMEYSIKEHMKDRALKMPAISKLRTVEDILILKDKHEADLKAKEKEAQAMAEAAEHMAGVREEDRVAQIACVAASTVSVSGSRFAKRPTEEAPQQDGKRRRQKGAASGQPAISASARGSARSAASVASDCTPPNKKKHVGSGQSAKGFSIDKKAVGNGDFELSRVLDGYQPGRELKALRERLDKCKSNIDNEHIRHWLRARSLNWSLHTRS
jgi:hypothetical protein